MSSTSRFALAVALLLTAGNAGAAAPQIFTYSGFLTDGAGNPVTASSTLEIKFYDALTAGNLLGSETVGVLPNADGYFSVIVGTGYVPGTVASFDALFASQTWMAIRFQGDAADMDPRIPLTSVPSAMSVEWAGVTGFPASSCSGATPYVTGVGANGAVTCGAAPSGTGTVTGVTAGVGLTGGGTSGTVTLAADYTAVQQRVSGTCGAGSYMSGVNQNGTVACQTDGIGVTGITATLPLVIGGTAAVPDISMPAASVGSNGYLTQGDWATFNSKAAAVHTHAGSDITSEVASATWSYNAAASSVYGGSLYAPWGSPFDGDVPVYDAFSGGFYWVTRVASVGATANGGIAIAGTASAPTVGLAACATAGYAMKWNGTSWACAFNGDTFQLTPGEFAFFGAAAVGSDGMGIYTVPALSFPASANSFVNGLVPYPSGAANRAVDLYATIRSGAAATTVNYTVAVVSGAGASLCTSTGNWAIAANSTLAASATGLAACGTTGASIIVRLTREDLSLGDVKIPRVAVTVQ